MRPDDPLRSVYSAADETIAELDRLNAASAARRTDWLGQLRQVVGRLDRPDLDDETEPVVERPQRDDPRRPTVEDERDPFGGVAPPQRTTPGGPFGPKVRDRLIREALAKSGW